MRRGCDFFEYARKPALKTKSLRALKNLVNEKRSRLRPRSRATKSIYPSQFCAEEITALTSWT
jgi:hypothetical protein